jgi:hypothetical protein
MLATLASPVAAQDKKPPVKRAEDEYRQFFKKPETALEFWAAMRFEIEVGKYALAAEDLKGFIAQKPTDEELLQIEAEQGISAFLRLLAIPELREDAKPLLERVTALVKKKVSDPQRIGKLVNNLRASPEERAYAIAELRRSGAYAVPHLINALRAATEAIDRATILRAMTQLTGDIVPPVVAALDIEDADIRVELIELLRQRLDTAATPFLWSLAASPKQPEMVKRAALETLVLFERVKTPDQLTPAKIALTREAERYYQHQAPSLNATDNLVWQWKNGQLVSQTMTASQAEEYFGLRFAGQALDIDPGYEPAQVVFLSLALEKGFERSGLDQPLEKGAPEVKQLLRIVNPELIMTALDRALNEHRLPVILGCVRSLGDLAEVRAVRPISQREPALLRALFYPDRRVQLAAADAWLRIPTQGATPSASRIVDILRRSAAADAMPRVIVADGNKDRAAEIGQFVRGAGFEPILKYTGRDVLLRLREAADIDAVVVDYAIPNPMLPHLLGQLRADADFGLLPVLIIVPLDKAAVSPSTLELKLRNLAEHYRNAWVIPTPGGKEEMKGVLTTRIAEAVGRPFSEEERKANAALAMLWLKRLATGEVAGYDVRPAQGAILKALQSPDLATLAIEAAGGLPGAAAQQDLAKVVLENGEAKIRAAAAFELSRHIQQHGLALTKEQVQGIDALYSSVMDPALKNNVALVLGSMHPDPRRTGERLLRFTPAPAPVAKEK